MAVTFQSLNLSNYVTQQSLDEAGYLTAIPEEYVTDTELNAKGYLTAVPDEYVTDTELQAAGYATTEQLGNYVQKVEGMGLSSNDFTDADAQKLDGVAENANDYVHPDTPGWIHLPADGATGQVVGWSADGTGQWIDPQKLYLINVPTSVLTANCSYNDGVVTSMFTVDVPTILGLSASDDYRQVVAVLQYILNFGIPSQYNQIQVILDTNGITDPGTGVKFGYQIDAKLVPQGNIEISLQVGSYEDTDCSNFKMNVGNLLILVAVQSNLANVSP